ncbi:MAG TPA: hypothetical protein VGM06_23885 [Polyangiaceae bacterium]|jgi:hypothetical protein
MASSLPRRGSADLPAPNLAPYGGAQIKFAIAAWPMRAAEELRSARIFRALWRASHAAHVPEPSPGRFESGMRDELRHAHLCASVGARLGAPSPTYDARPVRARLATLEDPLLRTLSLLLVELAIGETISTYLFRAGRRGAIEPLTRAALTQILGDEVRHQRLGWMGLSALWPALPDALRAAAQREASRGLAACEQQTARPAMECLQRKVPFDPAYAALGVLHPEARIEAFYFAVERFVVPRLSGLGLDGGAAWEQR